MFERFTERARQVVVLAQDEARGLRHNYIGTEHLLLGLLREEEGLGARTLEALGLSLAEVRSQVARIVGQGDEVTTGQIPFTPRAKQVLERALEEAQALGHDYIGTEHLLLGLARSDGVSAQLLADAGASTGDVHAAVLAGLEGSQPPLRMRDTSTFVTRVPAGHDWLPVVAAALWLALGLAVGVLLGWSIWG